ncbi:MAG: universal stress protein [Polyangiales bacterium]
MFKRIVVATDLQPCTERALAMAVRMTQASIGATLTVVHVFEPLTYAAPELGALPADAVNALETEAQHALDQCVKRLRETAGAVHGVLAQGIAWQEIIHVAEQNRADLLVVGTHGRRGLAHAVRGSVAERVVQLSPIPVLTVRGDSGVASRACGA